MRLPTRPRNLPPLLLAGLLLAGPGGAALGCSGRTEAPPQTVRAEPPAIPADQVLVSVAAASNPPGATVTGGGALLGRTPFTTQVPVPRPRPGEAQTFEFTFQLPGYQTQTITASPVNNTLTLNVLMQPDAAVAPPGTPPTPGVPTPGTPTPGTPTPGTPTPGVPTPGVPTPGRAVTFRGRGGGRIVDNSQARGTAQVDVNCVIGALSVSLNGTHTYFSDLIVTLVGPDGQRYQLQNHGRANPFRTHSVRRARGHTSFGEWTIIVADDVRADSGELRGWSMDVTCQ
jgi:hypothetical protein